MPFTQNVWKRHLNQIKALGVSMPRFAEGGGRMSDENKRDRLTYGSAGMIGVPVDYSPDLCNAEINLSAQNETKPIENVTSDVSVALNSNKPSISEGSNSSCEFYSEKDEFPSDNCHGGDLQKGDKSYTAYVFKDFTRRLPSDSVSEKDHSHVDEPVTTPAKRQRKMPKHLEGYCAKGYNHPK